jgi:hypothetical protein
MPDKHAGRPNLEFFATDGTDYTDGYGLKSDICVICAISG